MTIECYKQLVQALSQGPVVLATVINTKGSVPREVGAKMIITSKGQIFNTIGGGAGEGKVIAVAKEVLKTGVKQLVEIDLSGSAQRQTQGICGGLMEVWLEPWNSALGMPLVIQILDLLKLGQTVRLITPFAANQSPYLADSTELETFIEGFSETIYPPPTLLIVGAGHVGEQLAKVAYLAGFDVVVQDDRPEWASRQRYPQASMIITESVQVALNKLAFHRHLYAALVTRGYQYDLEALDLLLKRDLPCQYIGMIGSEKRVLVVYQALAKRGVSQENFKAIYAPIGLDIGALTPEEIAISICAELILVRRGGSARCLSEKIRQKTLLFSISEKLL